MRYLNFAIRKTSLVTLGCAVLVLLTASAFAQTTQPTSKAVQNALKYCPADAFAAVHIDTKTAFPIAREFLESFLAMMKKENDNSFPADMESTFQNTEKCLDLIKTNYDTIQVYAAPKGVLIVLQGTPADDNAVPTLLELAQNIFFTAMQNGKTPTSLPAIPAPENGRYLLPTLPLCVINGKEASDLPKDIVFCGPAGTLTPEFISTLGKTPPAELASLLKKVDTAKPIWAAIVTPNGRSSDAPIFAYGWLDPKGKGNLNITFSFATKEIAQASGTADILSKFDLADYLKCQEKGKNVVFTLVESGEPFNKRFSTAVTKGLYRARAMAKQAVAQTCLRGLGTAIVLYDNDEGKPPANWSRLMDNGYCSAKSLRNPLSNHPAPTWNEETKTLKGEVDFVLLDFSKMRLEDIKQPDKTLLAYAKPEVYKNYPFLKIPVLFADCHVAQMDTNLLKKYLAGTKAFLAGKPLPELPPIPKENPPATTRPITKAPARHIPKIHFYCLKTKKEFVLDPTKMIEEDMIDPGMMGPNARYLSPYTKERTAVPMTRCPACKKWFVPEYYQKDKNGKEPPAVADLICPHCKTNVIQWYRDHRKKRSTPSGLGPSRRTRRRRTNDEDDAF